MQRDLNGCRSLELRNRFRAFPFRTHTIKLLLEQQLQCLPLCSRLRYATGFAQHPVQTLCRVDTVSTSSKTGPAVFLCRKRHRRARY